MSDHDDPVGEPVAEEQRLAREALDALRDPALEAALGLTVPGRPEPIPLPPQAVAPLREILENLAAGRGVTVIPAHVELTTQQAAELLGISRTHLVKLLHEGHIRYRFVGRHRRVLLSSLLAYRRTMDDGHGPEDVWTLPDAVGLN
ncbi:helix-turn-helix domain-containing protein [Nocardia farcinica]|uniref:helix-turn-helix domain-containing protein n=1 Tax=Nocardia farcinica TaxID=37329 RepID=UPI002458E259|nr:helix-turn-helix domain-containing protein [Nocardia farcinica]